MSFSVEVCSNIEFNIKTNTTVESKTMFILM